MTTSATESMVGRRVLVTDGEQRATLAIVRSLGASGATPIVCSSSGKSLAGASRFAAAEVRVPDPLEQADAFVESLRAVIHRHHIECLLPVTESALRPVLSCSDEFSGVLLPFPPQDTFGAASDKRRLTELARQIRVPVPNQTIITVGGTRHLFCADSGRRLRFPLVVKPSRSVADAGRRSLRLGVQFASDPFELELLLGELPAAAFPVLIQERVVGPGIGVFLLRWDGRILARFAHRRLREKPPSGGVSVYREAIDLPADALAYAEALLEALDWRGVAMVEFKRDVETDTPYLMEINGRFWGSLQLAIDAGVDFPRLLVEAALGHRPSAAVTGKTGLRLRWLLGDLDHLLLRLRKSNDELALGSDTPGRLRTLASFLVPWRPQERWEVLRLSDPRPFLRELRQWAAQVLVRP